MITVFAILIVAAVPAGFAFLWFRSDAALRRREAGILAQLAQLAAEVEELRTERDRARAARERMLGAFRRFLAAGEAAPKEAAPTLDKTLEAAAAGAVARANGAEPDDDDAAETRVYARTTLASIPRRPS